MKKYLLYIVAALGLGSLAGCKKYLDVTPEDYGTLDYAFRNRNEAENYLFTCYSHLQYLNWVAENPGFTTSSEIIYPNDLQQHPISETGFNLIRGTQNAGNPGLNYWDGSSGGNPFFKAIRKCNTMLENMDKPVDLSAAEKQRWTAETKFLKAYYNYFLFRLYGPIPIMDVNLPVNAPAEEVRVYRQPVDSVVTYIKGLLDEAIPDLPPMIENQAREMGRITRLVALSVKAELLMMAASPLFNGNPDYAGLKDNRGQLLFSATYDPAKWDTAVVACREAIRQCEANGLRLYEFMPPPGSSQLSDSLKQVLSVQHVVAERWEENPELIWAVSTHFPYQGYVIPRFTSAAVANSADNPAYFAVPLSTGELFYTNKGVPMNEDKTFDYAGRFTPKAGDDANYFYIRKDYETAKAHFGREARFYANIGFDGGNWYGNGRLDQHNMFYVQGRGPLSLAGPKDIQKRNITGYWPKKLASYLTVYDDRFTHMWYHLPVIRLAGMYLLYAEALNEVNGPSPEVYDYIDRVRTRAGLPGVLAAWSAYSRNPGKPTTKEGLRDIIHHERRVELCFEAQSGYDLRRWKELQAVLSKPLQGWSITEVQAVNYYRPRTVYEPIFGLRDYLFPIQSSNIIVNENLVQNPYW
ncbi:MAG: RagB/SusD family nutrient uptake outer membrane protein [Candidatus Pseudobacter hemicellulosilyticus]|uniref:RagB/SusD family nutrient uptake outer membrane protein n=1 Tax=Candidatus Pseudobacter hemicellulosilyticus TaxID=3121375 RepID=A0AAJ6BG04_9BACT|nr:MAG: RagB/SusD family nutrient uptake outer membrane protein [Pseudobacter sp.]